MRIDARDKKSNQKNHFEISKKNIHSLQLSRYSARVEIGSLLLHVANKPHHSRRDL